MPPPQTLPSTAGRTTAREHQPAAALGTLVLPFCQSFPVLQPGKSPAVTTWAESGQGPGLGNNGVGHLSLGHIPRCSAASVWAGGRMPAARQTWSRAARLDSSPQFYLDKAKRYISAGRAARSGTGICWDGGMSHRDGEAPKAAGEPRCCPSASPEPRLPPLPAAWGLTAGCPGEGSSSPVNK